MMNIWNWSRNFNRTVLIKRKHLKTNFFENYLFYCKAEFLQVPDKSRIITSDGVFDGMLDVRNLNEGIDEQREGLFNEYWNYKRTMESPVKGKNLLEEGNFQQLKRLNQAKKMSRFKFVNSYGEENIKEFSNGENAIKYLKDRIDENGIFILDLSIKLLKGLIL